MNYIGAKGTYTAMYCHIRHRAKYSHTKISTPVILARTLETNRVQVYFLVPQGQGHGGDYDSDELMEQMDSISK